MSVAPPTPSESCTCPVLLIVKKLTYQYSVIPDGIPAGVGDAEGEALGEAEGEALGDAEAEGEADVPGEGVVLGQGLEICKGLLS